MFYNISHNFHINKTLFIFVYRNNIKYTMTMSKTRTVRDIALEIHADWKNVNYAARPYLEAIMEIRTEANKEAIAGDRYYWESTKGIILYFLTNAATWRGEKARQIKVELKNITSII